MFHQRAMTRLKAVSIGMCSILGRRLISLEILVRIFDRIISSKKYYHSSMILKTTEGKDTYPMDRNRWHKWEVKIPQGVSCEHCILQVVNF